MSQLSRMIRKLEAGHEFCGHCGKDITDQPDCVHRHTSSCSFSSSDERFIHGGGCLVFLAPIRVTELDLMYQEELTSLPIFDPVLVSYYIDVADLFRINEVIEAKGHSLPVRYVRPLTADEYVDRNLDRGSINGSSLS